MTEEFGAALAPRTTMRVGGLASRLITAESVDELIDAVREVDDADEPLLVMGGGSNLVFSDAGFPGTVVKAATHGVTRESIDACGGAMVRAAAGEPWDDLVALAVGEGWSGIEALSGIPGSAGATPIQNVGAYGQEVAQTIASVRTWDRRTRSVRTFAALDCAFTYRHSLFKETPRYVVLDVLFQFVVADLSAPVAYADLADHLAVPIGTRAPLPDVRDAVMAQRRRRGMVIDELDHDTWSCGSFFTNPVLGVPQFDALVERVTDRLGPDVRPPRFADPHGNIKTSAAWLIEKAGFPKGYGVPGPATLSTKHTLAVTNRGAATARDVVALAREIRDGVRMAFGVTLVSEPRLVGVTL